MEGAAYVDWLEKMDRIGGELRWVWREKDFPLNASIQPHPTRRTPAQIKQAALKSSRVRGAIREECQRRGCDRTVVEEEATEILDEMAHAMTLSAVRLVGYAVAKAIKNLFEHVYVNESAMAEIRELCKTNSVVFVPSHKSYLDFILLSLICFDMDVPLPAIAAGADFMTSKILGEALRHCGAFFIRRSFGNDRLYWAVFTEYVQTHLVHSDHTVEFFVEGTRSRTGKSLQPKFGLLQVLMEPFLRGQVFDLIVVPVAINYDKILEEQLYAYELLGFSKPKETASGLFKALQVLRENFGDCYMTLAKPISLRRYFGTNIKRTSFVCQPDSQFLMTAQEKKEIRNFGHDIIRRHNENAVTSVWPIVCHVFQLIEKNSTCSLADLRRGVSETVQLLDRLAIKIHIRQTLEKDFEHYLELHADLFEPFAATDPNAQLKLRSFPVDSSKDSRVHPEVVEKAVAPLIVNNYASKAMHLLAVPAMLTLIVTRFDGITEGHLFQKYREMERFFSFEFIEMPGQEAQRFQRHTTKLLVAEVIAKDGELCRVKDRKAASILAALIEPYLRAYSCVSAALLAERHFCTSSQQVVDATRSMVVRKFLEDGPATDRSALKYHFLSSDLIKNAFQALVLFGALDRLQDEFYTIVRPRVEEILREMETHTGDTTSSTTPMPTNKL